MNTNNTTPVQPFNTDAYLTVERLLPIALPLVQAFNAQRTPATRDAADLIISEIFFALDEVGHESPRDVSSDVPMDTHEIATKTRLLAVLDSRIVAFCQGGRFTDESLAVIRGVGLEADRIRRELEHTTTAAAPTTQSAPAVPLKTPTPTLDVSQLCRFDEDAPAAPDAALVAERAAAIVAEHTERFRRAMDGNPTFPRHLGRRAIGAR